ncbi:TetR/AcrR family transcriptional regulator [Paraglaciecola aestuariivivens]
MTKPKQTRSDIKRAAILQGAQLAFKQFGVGDTSMDKIAEIAKVSKRTVYNHFESKEILVTHIIKDIWSKTVVGYEVVFTDTKPLKQQLIELVLNEIRVSQNQDFFELVRVAINYTFFSPDEFRTHMHEFFEQDTALIRWLKDANAAGKFNDLDPLKANEQIVSLIKGQAFWPQILRFEPPLSDQQCTELATETADLVLSRYQA